MEFVDAICELIQLDEVWSVGEEGEHYKTYTIYGIDFTVLLYVNAPMWFGYSKYAVSVLIDKNVDTKVLAGDVELTHAEGRKIRAAVEAKAEQIAIRRKEAELKEEEREAARRKLTREKVISYVKKITHK